MAAAVRNSAAYPAARLAASPDKPPRRFGTEADLIGLPCEPTADVAVIEISTGWKMR